MTELSTYKNQLERIETQLAEANSKLATQESENHTLQPRLEATNRSYKAEKKRANKLAKENKGLRERLAALALV